MESGKLFFQNDLSRFLQTAPSVCLVNVLPLPLYRCFIHCMGFIYYALHRREAAIISTSIGRFSAVSNKGFHNPRTIKIFLGIFDHYYEKLVNAHRPIGQVLDYLQRHIDIPRPGWIDQLTKSGQGGLFVTGHFGAVEFLPAFMAIKNYKPSIVLRYKTQELNEALTQGAHKIGLELIDADLANAAHKAIGALKKGRILITLCDEFDHWRPAKGRRIWILGRHMPLDKTLDVLYRRTRVPVCLGLMLRTKKRYALQIHPIADGHESLSVSVKAWEILSQYIFNFPDQWYHWKELETNCHAHTGRKAAYASV
jgi:KDO2-lipid IV(A) lauroyltransferase